MSDREILHWKLWRFSVDWFIDNAEWFLYFRYRKPKHIVGLSGIYNKVYEMRFSSAGFIKTSYVEVE